MAPVLIGSQALKYWYPDSREPNDCDFFAGTRPYPMSALVPIDLFVDERLAAWPWGTVATPDELYTIKISHSFWEIGGPQNWDKHAADIVWLERRGAKFHRKLYDLLLPIWKERHKKHPINLDVTTGEFFSDAVDRKYVHDSLHESVAYYDRPLYERVLRDGAEVATDWSRFLAMDPDDRLRLVREEIYVTALERVLIPDDYTGSPRAAYHWALRRTVTSLFRGEWALYVLLHLDTLMRPDIDYRQRHLDNNHRLVLNDRGEATA
jgi:hypothetical protein